MAAHSAKGFILRKYYLRETSYILVIFTQEFGKIRGVLKGVRDPYPQFAGNFEIFTQCEVTFYKKKRSMDLITKCETLDFFLPVRKDIERLTYANYFIELVDVVTKDYDINIDLYTTLTESLRLLATDASPKRVSRVFELKLLGALGLTPELASCAVCGGDLEEKPRFSVSSGGVICQKCARGKGTLLEVSKGTLNFMRKVQESSFDRIQQVKVSKEVGKETEEVLRKFIEFHINRRLKSLNFLRDLKKVGVG